MNVIEQILVIIVAIIAVILAAIGFIAWSILRDLFNDREEEHEPRKTQKERIIASGPDANIQEAEDERR